MSFLHQLKSQADAVQASRQQQDAAFDQHLQQTEAACRVCHHYLQDLARQLDVLTPAAPVFSLDGKVHWPAMKLAGFRVDARKKTVRSRDVVDYVAMGWDVVPQDGASATGSVTVNFPPDLERVQQRLSLGMVPHERKDIRHPEKNTLLAFRFEHAFATRGGITITPDHATGMLKFRLLNLSGFGVAEVVRAASQVTTASLDELAKLVVGQPSRFA